MVLYGIAIFMFLLCLQITPINIDVRVTVKCVHMGSQVVQKSKRESQTC